MNKQTTTDDRRVRGMRSIMAAALPLCALMLYSSASSAYSWRTCEGSKQVWDNSRANMYISTTSFPAGSTWDSRLQNAMWHWNNVKGSRFNFYVGRDTDGTHRSGNGKNEVYWDDSADLGSALAVTFTRSHCYWLFGWRHGIDETDIGFNGDYSWSTGAYSYSRPTSSPFSFEGVALHELGHALGLLHEDRWMATMNSIYPNSGPLGQSKQWDPLGDDRLGARYLYPDSTAESDIAASTHRRTGSGTSNLTTSTTVVSRGGRANLQYTFTNLSTASKSFNIGFYLSSNDYISTYDRLLGWNTGASAGAGGTGTFTRGLTIPSTIAPGTYWLGVIVDYDGSVGEANEGNNAQVAPRSIRIN